MKLEKPSLPISISLEDAKAMVEDAIKEKGWKDFEIAELQLLYVPFFVFNYEAFQEAKTEESETPVVSETENGRMAINAFDSELNEEVAGLLDEFELQLEKQTTKEYPFELQKARLSAEEAKQLAQIKLAAQLSLGKDNIVISAIEMVFVPVWITEATIEEQSYRVEVNAVSSNLAGLEELSERGKGYGEVTKETLSELKNPIAWLQYSVSIVVDTAKWFYNLAPIKYLADKLLHNRSWQIAVLFAIVILILLRESGYL